MNPTHQFRSGTQGDAICWHYAAPINNYPVWIEIDFHQLGDGCLTHRSGFKVHPGDWIILPSDSPDVAFVLTDSEFHELFVELPISIVK